MKRRTVGSSGTHDDDDTDQGVDINWDGDVLEESTDLWRIGFTRYFYLKMSLKQTYWSHRGWSSCRDFPRHHVPAHTHGGRSKKRPGSEHCCNGAVVCGYCLW